MRPRFPGLSFLRSVSTGALTLGLLLAAVAAAASPAAPRQTLGAFRAFHREQRSLIVETSSGTHLRLTPYGDAMLRVQVAAPGREFLPDTWLPMIERHDVGGSLVIDDRPDALVVRTNAPDGVELTLAKATLAARWRTNGAAEPQLTEAAPVSWTPEAARLEFNVDPQEHFAGLGHGLYGRDTAPLDLRGRTISREYGFQATLFTPWFLSSKGYGFFLNAAFPHRFRFDADGHFDVQLSGLDLGAQLDYVVIAGRTPLELIDRYTQLTGRPRLQRRAMFGLQVSDKPHEAEARHEGAAWWYDNFPKLRAAGIPTDAIIMDNTWRAGGGTWSDSIFAFNPKGYSDPRQFRAWADRMGVMVDVDFNGPMYLQSAGWKPEFGVRGGIWKDKKPFYLPNFFRPDVNDWLWHLVWHNVLDPKLGYPNDMLWMDETDQALVDDERAPFADGRPWSELKNLYAMTGARALVAHWDESFAGTKRSYIWFRTATSGMQRYCVYWSGDLQGNESDGATQIPAMLAAGICGMPYFNHDAGGWHSTNEDIYRRYGLVAGSLSPVWRLHGLNGPRWPNEYRPEVLALAQRYAQFRYRLYDYLYTLSRQATVDGTPMMHAMFVDYPREPEAWKRDYQYLIGSDILVAPPVATRRDVWLPPGRWTNWWTSATVDGNRVVDAPAGDDAAIYVRAGAVLPVNEFALSSAFIPNDRMEVHVWVGADGAFTWYEDDGTTEKYRDGERGTTALEWNDATRTLHIHATHGHWAGRPDARDWTAVIHGLDQCVAAQLDGQSVSARWDATVHTLSVRIPHLATTRDAEVRLQPAP